MVTRTLTAALLLATALSTTATAQDVVVLAPPEMDAVLEPDEERPPWGDQLRLGFQLDVEPEIALLPFNFGGVAAYRPDWATLEGERFLVRPLLAFRLRSPGKGTEMQVARRTTISGGELELVAAVESTFQLIGILGAYARWDGTVLLHQATISDDPMEDDNERLLTTGMARTGPGAGVIVGPVLLGVDLRWHWVLFGAETFEVFREIVTDRPRLGVTLVTRISSHLFAHFRILPSTDAVFPDERWTAGVSASFDPFVD